MNNNVIYFFLTGLLDSLMAKLIDLKISCLVKMLQHEYMTKMLFILRYRLSVLLLITERKVQNLTLPPPPKKKVNEL